jgi:hypothetical protein
MNRPKSKPIQFQLRTLLGVVACSAVSAPLMSGAPSAQLQQVASTESRSTKSLDGRR